ncbi:MAG: hypothetical protein IT307_02765 [Chloroflexi bacterium]|nr:hypothetical protein [Chloroflexota bacterium]
MASWRAISATCAGVFRGWRSGTAAPSTAPIVPTESGPAAPDLAAVDPDGQHRQRLREAVRSTPPYPAGRFAGAGIVLVAGGPRYFTCAWVCLSLLRRVHGCALPIQLWHLGPDEMSAHMKGLLTRFDVEVVDAFEVRRRYPARRLGGWECKPYAILHSGFKDVIYLDADNVPLRDPTALLSDPQLVETGALFWPDCTPLGPDTAIWEICGLPYLDEPAFESGQIVVDKARCWAALSLTRHMNDWSDFFYQHVHGDKDLFRMAWRMLDQPYSISPFPPREVFGQFGPDDAYVTRVLEQRDFSGRPLFHHRTAGAKWNAFGRPFQAPGFPLADACDEALGELRAEWSGWVSPPPRPARPVLSEADVVRTRRFSYWRIGADNHLLELLPDHRVGEGASLDERTWRLEQNGAAPCLVLTGDFGDTVRLTPSPDGVWRGRWLHYEQMPVELIPL